MNPRGLWLVLVGALGCTQTTELLAPGQTCTPPGSHIRLGGTDSAHCTAVLAARHGRYAVCSCDDLVITGSLSVESLPAPPVAPTGSVGVDGYLLVWGETTLNGSLTVAGKDGIRLAGGTLAGTVRSGGPVQTLDPVQTSGDVYSAGAMLGPYVVGGALHISPSVPVTPEVTAPIIIREPVFVPPPCQCEGASTIDIAAAVAERVSRNDNSTAPFTAALASQVDTNQVFDVPCGEYYLPQLRTGPQASIELRVHGHVGIFVTGDVRLGGNLTVTLDRGSDLDLVVGGSFFTAGRLFGSPMSPADVRLWVGSTTVSLPDQIQFGALVQAPRAVFSAGVGVTINGSLFVQTLAVSSDVKVLYDPAANLGAQECGGAPPGGGPPP